MDLVDEEHVVGLHRGQDGGDVAGSLDRGTAGRAQVDAEFSSDDAGERGLTQTRRSVEQQVVERLVALFGGVDGDAYRLVDRGLTHELVQSRRTQGAIVAIELACVGIDHATDGRAFLGCVAIGRHSARQRKALRLATASGWSGWPLLSWLVRRRSRNIAAAA